MSYNLYKPQISTPFPGDVFYIESTATTMQLAREQLQKRPEHGWCIVAGYQTAGRGRLATRPWVADPNKNLLMTIILKENFIHFPQNLLSLAIGYSLAKVLDDHFGLNPQIKWPNDLLIDGRKIAGILGEKVGSYFLIGTGVNVNQKDFSFQKKYPISSLLLELKDSVNVTDLLEMYLKSLFNTLNTDFNVDFINQYLFGRDQAIEFLPSENKLVRGILLGLNADGGLIIKSEGKEHVFYSGEIHY